MKGNLTSDGASTYTYDFENRLTHVIASGSEAIYSYDYSGRRTTKDDGRGTIMKYVYDGANIIAEYDSSGTLLKKNLFGPGTDEILSTIDCRLSTTYYYHKDRLGSTVTITDSQANIVEKYTYDAYGNAIIKDSNDNVLSHSAINNRYLFTGREYDQETGLYYYRARMYSSKTGRFLQPDPIGYYDSANLYQYVGNNPINSVDPMGLCEETIDEKMKELLEKLENWLKFNKGYVNEYLAGRLSFAGLLGKALGAAYGFDGLKKLAESLNASNATAPYDWLDVTSWVLPGTNYGGITKSGPGEPTSNLDKAFKEHDEALGKAGANFWNLGNEDIRNAHKELLKDWSIYSLQELVGDDEEE